MVIPLLLKLCLFILEEVLSLETWDSSLAIITPSFKSFWEDEDLVFVALLRRTAR